MRLWHPSDLMTWQLWFEELFESTAIDPELIDKVILGCANQAAGDNRNIARRSILLSDQSITTRAFTICRLCASEFIAISIAAQRPIETLPF